MRVLVCGDAPEARGGMSVVMRTLRRKLEESPSYATDIELEFQDPRGQEDWTVLSSSSALTRIAVSIVKGVDLVHLNTASRGSTYRNMLIAVLAASRRTPYVVHLHGGGYEQFLTSVPAAVRYLIRRYFVGAARVVVLTPKWRSFVVTSLRVPAEHVCTVPNGTDAPGPGPLAATEHEEGAFVFVGRLTDDKGVPVLLRAFAELAEQTPARLLLIGGSADERTARTLAASSKSVEQLGWTDHDRAVALMAGARAVVLPSRMENMPLTVLEAMSVGTPVIATKVGGVPDMVEDGVEGLLVDAGDHEQLRGAMRALWDDPWKARSMGRRGQQRWRRDFDTAVMADRLVECWRAARV